MLFCWLRFRRTVLLPLVALACLSTAAQGQPRVLSGEPSFVFPIGGRDVHAEVGVLVQHNVRGFVVDDDSRQPIAEVSVYVVGFPAIEYTDADGGFELYELPAGQRTLVLRKRDYKSSSLQVVLAESDGGAIDLGVLSLSAGLENSAEISGAVFSNLGGPVPGTSIMLNGRVVTVTDGEGSFELDHVGLGEHLVEVRRIGFVPSVFEIDVPADESILELPVTMQPVPVELEMIVVDAERTIWVTGRMREFYDRRRSSLGHFLTSVEIEQRGPVEISDLLRELPGVRVMPGIGGARVGMLRGNSGPAFSSTGAGGCAPRVFLDGMRVTVDDDFTLDNLVAPEWIGGMEVYTSALSAPIRYGAATSCGVILIWTK